MVDPIAPAYHPGIPNAPVELGHRQAELTINGEAIRSDASVRLSMSPKLNVITTVMIGNPQLVHQLINGTGLAKLRFGTRGRFFPMIWSKVTPSSDGAEVEFTPQSGELCKCEDRRRKLQQATLQLINFRKFFCTANGTDFVYSDPSGGWQRLGRAVLLHDGFEVEIQAFPETSNIIKSLNETGGYGTTHVAKVRREDSRTFSVSELEKIVGELHLFLSFARGAWTGVFGVTGYDQHGNIRYEDWGHRLADPWVPRLSWFDDQHGQELAAAYPGFVDLLRNPHMGGSITSALYWYLRSNTSGAGIGVDGGLILSQAAIERLANTYITNHSLQHDRPAKDRIRRVWRHLRLSITIPTHARYLQRGRRIGDWADGPEAITKIRNDLTHSRSRLSAPIHLAVAEAWNLAQLYVELFILRIANYRGSYSNRLQDRLAGRVRNVPWVRRQR